MIPVYTLVNAGKYESHLGQWLAGPAGVSHLTTLCFSSHICKMEIMPVVKPTFYRFSTPK